MRVEDFSSGRIRIDGVTYEYDVVVDRGKIRKRKKKASKKFREQVRAHTVVARGGYPWKCRRLIIRTGAYGALPGDGRGQARGQAPQG